MTSRPVVILGGRVVDGVSSEPRRADVRVVEGRIAEVGAVSPETADVVIDASERLVMPGFVDAHSHVDALLFDRDVQRSLLRQGVTTVIGGQDGVSFAPGDGSYATEYFGALNGVHPTYAGGGVGELLASYDDATPLNFAYLAPLGTIRRVVVGHGGRPADAAEIAHMQRLVTESLDAGAVGVSSGLDYVPNALMSTAELTELCRPVADRGVYVTHMRGGYERNSSIGIDEVASIARTAGVPVHVSHFHGPAEVVTSLVDAQTQAGASITFDSYPYRRGCTLLTMPTLPRDLLAGGHAATLALLNSTTERDRLRTEWLPTLAADTTGGMTWSERLTLAHIEAPEDRDLLGLTLAEAARRRGVDGFTLVLDLLVRSSLAVSVVMMVRDQRPYSDMAQIIRHPAHLAGSDGIFIGGHPHPRARGSFAKYLRLFTRERGDWSWADAVVHLSRHAVDRFDLGARGRVEVGAVADLVVVDPNLVADEADYDAPMRDAVGIDDVLVAGVPVLAGGELTGATPGRGIRRGS